MKMSAAITQLILVGTLVCAISVFAGENGLLKLEDDRAVAQSIANLNSSDHQTRLVAVYAITYGDENANEFGDVCPSLFKLWKDPPLELDVSKAVGKIGGAAVPHLIAALRDPDDVIRKHALIALRSDQAFKSPSVDTLVASLITLLQDKSADIRNESILTVTCFGPRAAAALPDLAKLMKDQSFQIRVSSAQALLAVNVNSALAIQALTEALKDPVVLVRHYATHALLKSNSGRADATQVLLNDLQDSKSWTRELAMGILLSDDCPAISAALPQLLTMLGKEDANAATAIGRLGPEARDAIPALIEAMKNVNLRSEAATALGKIRLDCPDLRAYVTTVLDAIAKQDKTALLALCTPEQAKKIDISRINAEIKDRSQKIVRSLGTKEFARVELDVPPHGLQLTFVLENGGYWLAEIGSILGW